MPYFTYILQSKSTGKLYIGQTSDIEDRLYRHNSNETLSTKNRGPWEIIFYREYTDRSAAVKLEQKLKSFKNKQRILRWIKLHAA